MNKTAIITLFGLYEYHCISFVLKNAAQTFQRLMDTVFQNVDIVYLYILVVSMVYKDHLRDLQIVCQWLKTFGLIIRLDKCDGAAGQMER